MAVSVEHRALHHAIDDLRTATTSLQAGYGDIPAVARLRNDLERLVLDVADIDALPGLAAVPAVPGSPSVAAPEDDADAYAATSRDDDPHQSRDDSPHQSWDDSPHQSWDDSPHQSWDDNPHQSWDDNPHQSWDDVDDEGVGGFRGGTSAGSTGRKGR